MKKFLFAEHGGFRRDIDSGVFVLAALLLAILVINSFNFLPLMLPAAIAAFALDDAQVNQLATSELVSTSLASLAFSLFMMRRVNWRWVGIASCLLQLLCNLASLQAADFQQLLGLRVLAGVGQGIGYSLALVGLGVSLRPGRSFGLWICATNLWLGALFLLLPSLMDGATRGGIEVLFGFYALTAGLGALLFLWYPDNGRRARDQSLAADNGGVRPAFRHFALPVSLVAVAIMLYHMAVGVIYPYLVVMGEKQGLAAEPIQYAIVAGTFGAALVGWLAALSDHWRNDLWSLLVVGLLHALAVWLYAGAGSESGYLAGVVAFLAVFNLFTALLFKAMSQVDRSGYLSSLGPELSATGIFAGPLLATALVGPADLASQVRLAALFTLIALALVMAGRSLRRGVAAAPMTTAKEPA